MKQLGLNECRCGLLKDLKKDVEKIFLMAMQLGLRLVQGRLQKQNCGCILSRLFVETALFFLKQRLLLLQYSAYPLMILLEQILLLDWNVLLVNASLVAYTKGLRLNSLYLGELSSIVTNNFLRVQSVVLYLLEQKNAITVQI